MGKIRVKTLGDEGLEKEQKKQTKKKQEQKKLAKVLAEEKPDQKETVGAHHDAPVAQHATPEVSKKEEKSHKTHKAPKTHKPHKSHRSKKYTTVAKLVDKNKIYSLSEALEILPKLKIAGFDETVELHINTIETGISGNISLPHGTGKKVRVAVATDELIAQIEKGKIDFDILLAEPLQMPKLAKVARILGPRGLMPNPKNGTISQKPEELVKKYESGQTSFKTEAKNPIIHLSVGKLSFGDKKLEENIKATINAIQTGKIRKAVLKSTMSPGLKINFNELT